MRKQTNNLHNYAKTKAQISFAVTAKLISAFVLATWLVQFLYFITKNFHPLAIFCACAARFVSDLFCEADQLICFRNTDSTIHLLPKSKIFSLWPSFVLVQLGLCQPCNGNHFVGFLMRQLNLMMSKYE